MTLHDLGALVIQLKVLHPTHIAKHLGRAVYALGLQLIGLMDEELAQSIHDYPQEKPYAASGLLRGGDVVALTGDVKVGDAAWIRLCGMSAEIVAALEAYRVQTMTQLEQNQEVCIEIDRMQYQVTAVGWDLPGGGLSSYQTLIERQRTARVPQTLDLNFLSPTTFRSRKVNMPLPLPELVFGSLVTRWQSFTPLRLRDLPADQVDAFIQTHLCLSQHTIRTQLLYFKDGGKEVGFSGSVRFELMRKSEHLAYQQPELEALIQQNYNWFGRTVALMADFAFYSHIGRKTTWGMGMAWEARR